MARNLRNGNTMTTTRYDIQDACHPARRRLRCRRSSRVACLVGKKIPLTLPGGSVEEKSYDGLLGLESLKAKNAGQQTTLELQDRYGKLLELKTSDRADSANGSSTSKSASYNYDDEIRLTQVQIAGDTETYTLDAVANRTQHSAVSGTWSYDDNNRLTQRREGGNATTYTWDDAAIEELLARLPQRDQSIAKKCLYP
jgi:hypothetical protein